MVLVMRPAGEARIRLAVHGDPWFQDLIYDAQTEIAALAEFLRTLRIGAVELHHFLDLDGSVVEAALGLGAPWDVYLHDYLWICPRITLIGGGGGYCGEPELSACEACLDANGGRAEPGLTVAALRARSDRWLAGARTVIAPANDVAARLRRYFPGVEIVVRPWESRPVESVRPTAGGAGPLKIAVVGAIGDHKGYQVLLACAQDAERRRLPLEFVVIGYTQDDAPLLATGDASLPAPMERARSTPSCARGPRCGPVRVGLARDLVLRAQPRPAGRPTGDGVRPRRSRRTPSGRRQGAGPQADRAGDSAGEDQRPAAELERRRGPARPPGVGRRPAKGVEIFSREKPVLTNQQALEHPDLRCRHLRAR